MRIRFPVDPYPPSNNYELVVCGRDDESDKKRRIRITLNGHKVFSGENPFVKGAWSCRAFALPIADLDHQNELRIQNPEPTSYQVGPPYFMVSYGVVREKK